MWFVYKETMFHRKTLQPQPLGTYPGINQAGAIPQQGQMVGQMGQMDQMGQQQQIQQQQAGQYTQYAGQAGYWFAEKS